MLTGGDNGKFKVLTVSEDKLSDSSNHLSRQSEATMSESSVKFVFVDSLGSLPPSPHLSHHIFAKIPLFNNLHPPQPIRKAPCQS